ncbi:adenine nucleotide alpha hydrolases-like protein [Gonapodya prolifera JEL478]|uniref:Adenine nucleotide alpha hydrolases-like protein n=1 Tax=Gonapodya prolifera (strain JEL478) TaxID=1344416 RepID=A0A139ADS4_GONPJ|nr:adenine nucleotide alpha hydrolases-like protein [Gonapodya prolifera JEL478]|eukprot:KXS14908.1 adenine nucleotide alpha hydrolases-like protein [Gonapodya prolifera JEL478]
MLFAHDNQLDDGHSVLVCTDFTDHSNDAVKMLLSTMLKEDDRIVLYQALTEPGLLDPSLDPEALNVAASIDEEGDEKARIMKATTQTMNEYMKEIRPFLGEKNAKVQIEAVLEFASDPGPATVAMAQKIKARFVVMGTRALPLMQSMLLGSVSHYVLENLDSSIPVVIIRGGLAKSA